MSPAPPLVRRLLDRRGRQPVLVGLSLVVLGGLLCYPVVDAILRHRMHAGVPGYAWVQPFHFNDFGHYATAIARWYRGEPLYWQNPDGGYFATYLYPPVYLLLFVPFVELGLIPSPGALPLADHPARVGGLLFEAASLVYLWIGLQLLVREFGLRLRWDERLLGLWALLGFQPLLFSIKLGQVSAFVAGTFCLAYVAMERGVDPTASRVMRVTSGALTTVASGIKLYYVTGGAHLLRDRDRLLGAIAAGVGILGLSLVVFGLGNHRAYLDILAWGKGWGEAPKHVSLWHPGYYEPLYVLGRASTTLASAVRVGVVLGTIGLTLAARHRPVRRATFALGLTIYPIAAPEVYTQDFVALLVAAVVLLGVEVERSGDAAWIPVLAVGLLSVHAYGLLFFLEAPTLVPSGSILRAIAPVAQPGLWGNVLLLGLAAWRVGQPLGDGGMGFDGD